MGQRTTDADLERLAALATRYCPPGQAVEIGHAYGQPRAMLREGHSCVRELSPRARAGEVAEWLRAFIDGAEMARRATLHPQDAEDREVEAAVLAKVDHEEPVLKGYWLRWIRAMVRLEARGELRLVQQGGPDGRTYARGVE